MQITERSWSSSTYRFGFGGQERDNEVNGDDNTYDFGARMYDPRLGRWLSVDPLWTKQPGLSPYKSFLNNPLCFGDEGGETEKIQTITLNSKGETKIEVSYKDRVMTDGKIHPVWDSRSSYHFENNYYNYTTTVVKYIDKKGKEHIMSTKSEIFDDRKVQSEYVWDTWNISKGTAGDPDGETARDNKNTIVENGGVAFYSSKGQGQESRITPGVVDMVDIGPILDAIGAFSPGGGMQKKLDEVFKQLDMGKDVEALKDAMSVMGNIMETYGDAFEKGYNLEEAIEKSQRKSSRTENSDSMSCIHCERTIHKETLRGSGNADFKHREQTNDD